MEKEDDKKCSHRSDKLSPTDNCQSQGKPTQGQKRKSCCSNCGNPGHNKSSCPEPIVEKKKKRAKTGETTVEDIINMFDI
jgi:hypothetical protein